MLHTNHTSIPDLYASTGFVARASELGMRIAVNPIDVPRVIQIARHEPILNLGALLLHGPNEQTGNQETNYRLVTDLPNGKTTFDTDYVPRQHIEVTAAERKLAVLALKGVEPIEKDLSEALYHAAVRKEDPDSRSIPIDYWFGGAIGGSLGLGGYVIGDGLEKLPTELPNYAATILVSAIIGTLAVPAFRAARQYYDMNIVRGLRPIIVYPRIVPR